MSTVPVAALDSPGLRYSGTVAHAISAALLRHGVHTVFGQSLPTLLHLANDAAGVKCGKLGVTPAHRSEIAARIKEFSHAHCA